MEKVLTVIWKECVFMWSHLNTWWCFPFSPVCFCAAERTLCLVMDECFGSKYEMMQKGSNVAFCTSKLCCGWGLGMRAKLQEFRLPSGMLINPEPLSPQQWFWFTGPKHSWLSSKVIWWSCSFQVKSMIFSNWNLLRLEKIKSQIHIIRGLRWLVDKAQAVLQEQSTLKICSTLTAAPLKSGALPQRLISQFRLVCIKDDTDHQLNEQKFRQCKSGQEGRELTVSGLRSQLGLIRFLCQSITPAMCL